ncbi:MAG: hypothetical protein KDA28_05315 [Phycisphaerales bacterium]|nr:hypothetical protein [Phycisphaerales bacterium]
MTFNTFYWEAELRSLFETCEAVTPASARLTDTTCKTYHYLMDKLNLDEFNNEQMVRQDNLLQCPICEEVTASSNVKPVAVIDATGFLVVHNDRFEDANQSVLVQVGFGSLNARIDEATSFVRHTPNAAVFVVVPPGERAEYTGKDVFDASGATNHEQDVTMAMAENICDDPNAPQPCLFFRDLEDWKFPDGQMNGNSNWYDVWRLNNPLEETSEADADELPYAGPLEFQDSTYHDLLDTDPYPQDSWFYRATFTIMRAITLLENLPDFPGV